MPSMPSFTRRAAAAAGLALLAGGLPALAQAQDYPAKQITIVVPFTAGGGVDAVARLLADKLRVSLGQNVIIDNKPGAGGRVALGEVKRAAPDGQTVVLSPSGALVIQPWLYANLGYDPVKDFTPISRVVTFDFAVTAGPAAPAGDLRAVLAWMRANPSKANYATSGPGTVPHFAGMMLGQTAGVNITHVAYRGGALAAQDLIAGQVPLMVDTASETIEHHKAGKVRIIAVTGEQRTRSLPDVPTLRELGINTAADDAAGLARGDYAADLGRVDVLAGIPWQHSPTHRRCWLSGSPCLPVAQGSPYPQPPHQLLPCHYPSRHRRALLRLCRHWIRPAYPSHQ